MRRLVVMILSGALLLAAGGIAYTAEGDAPSPLAFTKDASSLSGAEQLKQAAIFMEKIKEALTRVNALAEEARKEKDVIRLNCVNEKLIGIRGMLSVAEASYAELSEAVARDDKDERTYVYTKVLIAHTKVAELRAEAESCAGEVTVYFGDTVLEPYVDPDVPEEDPTEPGLPEDPLGGILARPTETSPVT
jgi:hypothetical protein